MASVSRDPGGRGYRVQLVGLDGRRKTLRLPVTTRRDAEAVGRHIDALLAAQLAAQPIPRETALWLSQIAAPFLQKLARLGLVEARNASPQLGAYLESWIGARRANYKPATVVCWQQVARDLIGFFGAGYPLDRLNADQAEKFRQHLVGRKLRDSTICRRLRHAKFFFAEAVQRGCLDRNPFERTKHREGYALERRAYVSVADTLRVIEQAPNVWWRLMIALVRFAGLRLPSEVFSLRWQAVNWDKGILLVTSPKTEHLPGRGARAVPLFPALRPYLEEAWEAAPKGGEYVLPEEYRRRTKGPNGWRNANLRTTLNRIVQRAGLAPWPRAWHSLRASCETDLVQAFPLPTVARWIGNTPIIAARHYIDVTDADFERATAWLPEGLQPTQKPTQQPQATVGSVQKATPQPGGMSPTLPDVSPHFQALHPPEVVRGGIEPPTHGFSVRCSTN